LSFYQKDTAEKINFKRALFCV